MKYYVVQYYEPSSERRTLMWSEAKIGARPVFSEVSGGFRGSSFRMTAREARTFGEMNALRIIRNVEVDRTFHIIKP